MSSSIENLFSVEPSLPSIQTHKMPDNAERWAEVLTTYLREHYPDTAKLPIVVEFRKKDTQSGTAIGALQVQSDDQKKMVLIPFIIKKYMLSPLDIWMEPNTQNVHPLDKDTFKEVFFAQSPAEGLDARPSDSSGSYFNDPSTWNTNYPPLQGRYSYASAGYRMLDAISDTMTQEDVGAFKQTLKDDPYIIAKFQKHGHAEVLEKIAKKTSFPLTNDYVSSAMKLIPTSVLSVKKEDYDKYSILSAVEGLFDTMQVERMDRHECEKHLSKITGRPQDLLNEVDQEGEKMLIIRKPAEGVFLYDAQEAGPEEAKDFAVYRAKNKQGVQMNGVVIPLVVDFTGKRKNMKLFLSKTHSSLQPSIAGIRMVGQDDVTPMKTILEPRDIRVGQTGTFIYIDDGKALATEPVTIKAIDASGELTAVDLNGKRFKIKRQWGHCFSKEEREASMAVEAPKGIGSKLKHEPKRTYLDAHGFLEVAKDIHVIPSKMMWLPMSMFSDLVSSSKEWMEKEAFAKMETDPMIVRYLSPDYFEISGAGLPKLAADKRRTKMTLANAGLTIAKIGKVMDKAKAVGKASVHGVDRLRPKESKISEVGKLMAKIANDVASLKVNLIKQAADIEDAETVDALLSLNFLTPDNLAKFVAYKPVFDKVLDYLAELTMASRLGLKEVDEASTSVAMGKLKDVCEGLHRLQAGMKRPSTKTAAAIPVEKKGIKSKLNKAARLMARIG